MKAREGTREESEAEKNNRERKNRFRLEFSNAAPDVHAGKRTEPQEPGATATVEGNGEGRRENCTTRQRSVLSLRKGTAVRMPNQSI